MQDQEATQAWRDVRMCEALAHCVARRAARNGRHSGVLAPACRLPAPVDCLRRPPVAAEMRSSCCCDFCSALSLLCSLTAWMLWREWLVGVIPALR